jgi:predicted MFS family arabinose efflux permease
MAFGADPRKLELADSYSEPSTCAPASATMLRSNAVVVLAESFASATIGEHAEDHLKSFGNTAKQAHHHLKSFGSILEHDADVQLWQIVTFLVCGSVVAFSGPTMAYALYKVSLDEVLDLSLDESQYIISTALVGGAFLGFLPGILYDTFGYAVTLLFGGFMSFSGSFLWYWLLQDGGAPNAPSWVELALSLLVMTFGARCQYVASMCAVMCIFPSRLTATVSAGMAVSCAVGSIAIPMLWRSCLPSEDDFDAYNPQTKNLANLLPLAKFHYILAAIYAIVTLAGLTIARWLPPKLRNKGQGSSLRVRLLKFQTPGAVTLMVLISASGAYVGTFMTSGVAEAAKQAGASVADTQSGMLFMGIAGLCGRFIHGVGADLIRTRTRARRAGLDIMFILAVSCTLVAFLLLMFRLSWEAAACLFGFGFGGLFALLPAAVMMTFDVADAGFSIGALFCVKGLLMAALGAVCSRVGWNQSAYFVGACGAVVTICTYVLAVCRNWGKK